MFCAYMTAAVPCRSPFNNRMSHFTTKITSTLLGYYIVGFFYFADLA